MVDSFYSSQICTRFKMKVWRVIAEITFCLVTATLASHYGESEYTREADWCYNAAATPIDYEFYGSPRPIDGRSSSPACSRMPKCMYPFRQCTWCSETQSYDKTVPHWYKPEDYSPSVDDSFSMSSLYSGPRGIQFSDLPTKEPFLIPRPMYNDIPPEPTVFVPVLPFVGEYIQVPRSLISHSSPAEKPSQPETPAIDAWYSDLKPNHFDELYREPPATHSHELYREPPPTHFHELYSDTPPPHRQRLYDRPHPPISDHTPHPPTLHYFPTPHQASHVALGQYSPHPPASLERQSPTYNALPSNNNERAALGPLNEDVFATSGDRGAPLFPDFYNPSPSESEDEGLSAQDEAEPPPATGSQSHQPVAAASPADPTFHPYRGDVYFSPNINVEVNTGDTVITSS